MKTLSILFIIFSFSVEASELCPLEGYWKFDKHQTLQSLYKLKGNIETPRKILTSNTSGDLYIYYDCNQYTITSDDWTNTTNYKVLSFTKNGITIKYKQLPEDNENTLKKISFHGNCFTTPITINNGTYNEFYCRTSFSVPKL